MRLFILGANGKTGSEIMDLALKHGHQVTAFVRSPEKIGIKNKRLAAAWDDSYLKQVLFGS